MPKQKPSKEELNEELFIAACLQTYAETNGDSSVKQLLKMGADPLWKSENGDTALQQIARYRFDLTARQRALTDGAIVSAVSGNPHAKDDLTKALYTAVRYEDVPLIKKLVTAGADMNAFEPQQMRYRAPKERVTPLDVALLNYKPNAARTLLKLGAEHSVYIPPPGLETRLPARYAMSKLLWTHKRTGRVMSTNKINEAFNGAADRQAEENRRRRASEQRVKAAVQKNLRRYKPNWSFTSGLL
ncbi:MAG: ankyrin repeat domain-containing protein [Alphaproteobacteria bacterium]|nr:ankyrin repeat domain-containing protein [Alphaproteobacteria bacterium]